MARRTRVSTSPVPGGRAWGSRRRVVWYRTIVPHAAMAQAEATTSHRVGGQLGGVCMPSTWPAVSCSEGPNAQADSARRASVRRGQSHRAWLRVLGGAAPSSAWLQNRHSCRSESLQAVVLPHGSPLTRTSQARERAWGRRGALRRRSRLARRASAVGSAAPASDRAASVPSMVVRGSGASARR